ncbi:hypothetical protein XENOCAPTIV_005502, partial [Xenoophorus captivus]
SEFGALTVSHRARGAARPTSNTQPPSPGPARPFGSKAVGGRPRTLEQRQACDARGAFGGWRVPD